MPQITLFLLVDTSPRDSCAPYCMEVPLRRTEVETRTYVHAFKERGDIGEDL